MAQKNQVQFDGSIPENYDRYLGPLIFEPYARDLVRRLPASGLGRVLELACGTGIVTHQLRERLDENTALVATDLSEGMLKFAQAKPQSSKKIEWKVADANALPFGDETFDAVVCQFGFMFFPDKDKAVSEIFRVLKPGGRLLFSVWDRVEDNDFAHVASQAINELFEGEPPKFLTIPYGYHDHYEIRTVLRRAGFVDVALARVHMKTQASAEDGAKGFIEGTPMSSELVKNGKDLAEVVAKVRDAIADELGSKTAKGDAQAIIVGGRKPGRLAATKPAEAQPKTAKAKTVKAPKAAKTKVGKARAPKPKPGPKPTLKPKVQPA